MKNEKLNVIERYLDDNEEINSEIIELVLAYGFKTDLLSSDDQKLIQPYLEKKNTERDS